MRILVVEDEHRIATALKKGLEHEKHTVDLAFDGTTGLDLATGEVYDTIILDLMLPGIDGLTICQSLRKSGNHTPILMLTAKSLVQDKVLGLNTGADDYLAKPFSFEELLARIKAISRRPKTLVNEILEVANLKLNPTNYTVTRADKKISLTNKEYSLLEYLLRHKNTILKKDQIISHVWNYDADVLPNTVEVYVKKLRTKIDQAFPESPPLIHTIRGFGYKVSLE